MAYVPNPTDPTQPADEVDASTAAAEFRALKDYVASIATPTAIVKNPVRQVVLQASVDVNGVPNFITPGAGLNFNIDGTSVPILMTFADGYTVNGAQDYNTLLTSNQVNQGVLPANNVSYISADYVSSSQVTFGQFLLPPYYGIKFFRNKNALLHFENSLLDDYGNTWTAPAGNTWVTSGNQKFGTYAAQLNGTSQYFQTTDILTLPSGSWEIAGWFNWAVLPAAAANQVLFSFLNAAGFGVKLQLNNTSGVRKLQLYLSSNGTTANITNGILGLNSIWNLNVWYKVRLVFDSITGTYKVYLSNNGAAETQDLNVASSARICPLTSCRIGASGPTAASFFNGIVDDFHFSNCSRANSVVVPAITADVIDGHWFDTIGYKMYEITGPSVVAGTPPVFTPVTRMFFARAETAAITVSKIVPYALRGIYDSSTFPISGVNVSYVKDHNIGNSNIDTRVTISQYSDGTGWKLFEGTPTYQGTIAVRGDEMQMALRTGATFIGTFVDDAGVSQTPAAAYARIRAQRSF
jgi:hypothetical protein